MLDSYSGIDGANTYATNGSASKKLNHNSDVISHEQGSAPAPARHTHREGLLHSIGSALYRTIPWLSGTNKSNASAQDETQSSIQSTFHPRTSRALHESSLLSSSEGSNPRPSPANRLATSQTLNRAQAPYKPFPRTKWGSLNLGPPTTPSLASTIQFQNLSDQPAPSFGRDFGDSVLGKRDVPTVDVTIDDQTTYTPSARKRRMLWDPEMGFVDTEDMAAHRPPPPPPQNEAERILRALESMRTPLGDARREKLMRSRSVPSWHSKSIPVPLPTPERESILAPPRSPAFHSISPHMRSLSRSQRLRQSLMGAQPGMSSKLRESFRDSDTLQEPPRYVHVDDELAVEELEKPERRLKREARKAEIQPKPSRAKILKTSTKKVGLSKENSEPTYNSNIHDPSESGPIKRSVEVDSRRKKFQVRKDNETGPSRSVLRQNSAKTSRRHAPSGRITAFDDDDDDDEPMPGGEELAKIKLPEFLFPSDFDFDASDNKLKSRENESQTPSLIERMDPKPHSDVTTTPAKEPAAGTVRFDLNSSAPDKRPTSSFFSTAPRKPADDNSLSKEKNSGPVPDFFSKSSKNTGIQSSVATSQLGLPGAQSIQPHAPEVKEQIEPTLKKRELDDENLVVKKPFSISASNEPAPIFSAATEKVAQPAFSFGQPAEKKEDKPAFSFGQPADKKEDKPAFSFGQSTEKKEDKPAFSFGQPAEKKEDKPAFSFGRSTEKKDDKPAFSFGQSTEKKDDKPAFSFGQSTEKKDDKPAFSFGQPAEKKEDKPAFSFGQPAEKKDDKPAFSFGQPAEKKEDKPAFSFGQSTEKNDDKPAFSFGQPAEKKDDKQTFSFATSFDKPATQSVNASTNKPAASFGQSATTSNVQPASPSPFSFGSAPASDAAEKPSGPSFTFGASAGSTASSSTFSFGKKDASASSSQNPQPAFSFGATSGEASPAPTFSFGQATSAPPVSFGSPAPTMSFGTAPAQPPASTTSFSFGAPAAPAPAPTTSFTFGSAPPSGTFQFGANAQSGAPAGAPTTSFSFGAGLPSAAPSFTFGSGSGGNSPATGSPAPFTFGTPPTSSDGSNGGNGLFNLGSSPAPAGRQIKPLRQSRRRN
ncbi:Nucleoporin NSP1 [Malassezia restricta CBS 7877]|uniref:Nucleoporin NSP1 n=1 Tax=Malassezia restricta (strain ATCC 96810 / NBRC 103918 / CBS 7877) TaxID=425264 RepID=A0A3G2S175_MALR7|nr:Nucleoporin NSP1 [Malassezia restricta CBS 7877]